MSWLNVTHAVSAATAYWSRAVYMIYNQGSPASGWSGPYQASDPIYTFSRPALADRPGLYVVLAVQPVITLIALLIAAWLWHVPIGRGFGLVSILSGYNPLASAPIYGAGLSGKLDRRVVLELAVTTPDSPSDYTMEGKVQCRIIVGSGHQFGTTHALHRGQRYG